MLIGSYEHGIDAKGRVFVPAKWREHMGESIILTEGILAKGDGVCLFGLSLTEWETFSARLAELPVTDLSAQAVKRRLYASAACCEPDKQGRILIPTNLRLRAGLEKEAFLIGVGNRIEFWSPEAYLRHETLTEDAYDTALTHLAGLGI